jgi:hypothetical protein
MVTLNAGLEPANKSWIALNESGGWMPQIREPKKGVRVPRETRDRNSIAELQETLRAGYPEADWDRLAGLLDGNGFFDAGMQQQVRIMAETAVGMLQAVNC